MNINIDDVDWKNLLLKRYIKYDLDELDCMTLFLCDAILKVEPNTLITCDVLLPYMRAKKDDIDASLAKLMNKKIITLKSEKTSLVTSIDDFKKKIFDDEIKDLLLQSSYSSTGDVKLKENLYSYIEELKGPLSPLERDRVTSWLKQGASEGDIKEACKKAMKSGRLSFNQADKYILELKRSESRKVIGASVVDEERRNNNEDLKKIIEDTTWSFDD